ncbi:unnamed protein product, partial [Didymodactylos carnosus]
KFGKHDHEKRALTTRAPSPIRDDVKTYVAAGLSETQIRRAVTIDHPQWAAQKQVRSLVGYYRTKDHPSSFSLSDLRDWCIERSQTPAHTPTESDTPFVPYFKLNDITEMFVFITTRRLLSTASLSVYLQVDGTYKLNWNNFPVLVCGTSDAQRHFHPFGIALVHSDESTACYVDLFKALKWSIPLVTNEAYYIHFLMADGSKAITKAQQQEFPCIRRLMCWAHVIRRCRAHKKMVPDDKWPQIESDICSIQLCCNDFIFDEASKLLLKKWQSDTSLDTFRMYFQSEWIDALPYWYEGSALRYPMTNNGLESLNGKIKKHYTLRSKLPLAGFLSTGCQMISDWSLKLHNCVFSLEPIVSKDLELFASKWSTSISKSMIPLPWNVYEQVVPTIHAQLGVQQCIDMYQHCQFNTFDNYRRWYESAHIVSVQQMYCTCRYFCKEYICKHLVGLKILYGIHKLPNDRLPLGKKPRGRPKKTSLALLF